MNIRDAARPTDDQIGEIAERIVDSTVNLFEFMLDHYGLGVTPETFGRIVACGVSRCRTCMAWRRVARGETCQDCKDKGANP